MKIYAIIFIVFGALIVIFPDLVWILVWSFFIFIWLNMLVLSSAFKTWIKDFSNSNDYVKWGKYKIFK